MSKVKAFCMSGRGLVTLALAAAVAYYLLVEHRDHIVYFLPYAIFLLCPLMHLFMHGKHQHGGDSKGDSGE
ncbi:DUF2933 domain-containing protein [Marinimicrobium locisalis]|uniref:DUF2933 domain-containing protein n=1 Tax=Marinimicrobium locisalis TaxID=546022 RepID=UPI003D300E1B